MTNAVRQKQEDCKGKRAVVLEELTENNSDAICVSRTHDGKRQGAKKVVCVDECEGHKKCAQLCMNHGEALDSTNRIVPSEVKLTEIFPGTFFATDKSFEDKLKENLLGKTTAFLKKQPGSKDKNAHFALAHYAGVVNYNITDWLTKNKDQCNDTV